MTQSEVRVCITLIMPRCACTREAYIVILCVCVCVYVCVCVCVCLAVSPSLLYSFIASVESLQVHVCHGVPANDTV